MKSKKIKNFGLFLESKKQIEKPVTGEVQKEVKKIISEMFAYGKNIKFAGDQNGEPEYVEFEVDVNDHKLDYDEDLCMEYSEGVLKKRKYQVYLKYNSKSKEGTKDNPVYIIRFKIKLKPSGEIESKKDNKPDYELAWEFEKKPIEVISFIKKERQSCHWNSSDNVLTIKKSAYDKLVSSELKSLIREEGGIKIQA
jgi:hypothetical protein